MLATPQAGDRIENKLSTGSLFVLTAGSNSIERVDHDGRGVDPGAVGVRAVLPVALAADVDTCGVHPGGAPRAGVAVQGGAGQMHPVGEGEGEDTVAAGAGAGGRWSRCGGSGASGGDGSLCISCSKKMKQSITNH